MPRIPRGHYEDPKNNRLRKYTYKTVLNAIYTKPPGPLPAWDIIYRHNVMQPLYHVLRHIYKFYAHEESPTRHLLSLRINVILEQHPEKSAPFPAYSGAAQVKTPRTVPDR